MSRQRRRDKEEEMKVTLLGTSAAEGWPGLFCGCEVCGKARALGGKNIRTRASALIDDRLKIDFPPDMLHQVLQTNTDLRCLTAVLFTHAHDDHCSPAELQYRGKYFVPTPFSKPLPIYGPVNVIRKIEAGVDSASSLLALHVLEPWQTVTIDGYRVTPILAQHDPDQICFNYLIQDSEGATLLYASDTGWYEAATWEYLEQVRLEGIVVECTKGLMEGGYMAHLCIPEVVRMRRKLIQSGSFDADSPVVTTHFSHLSGLLHHELEAQLNPHHIQTGYDGMTFHIGREALLKAPRSATASASAHSQKGSSKL
jgi:phosphoribosyl 1,2-cyclic phosphate phosphodiesterase